MKKIVLVISHLASGSTALCQILDKNPRIQWCRADLIYNHPDILESLTSQPHKLSNSAAIWLDDVLYNFSFSHKSLYQCCKYSTASNFVTNSLCQLLVLSAIHHGTKLEAC